MPTSAFSARRLPFPFHFSALAVRRGSGGRLQPDDDARLPDDAERLEWGVVGDFSSGGPRGARLDGQQPRPRRQ